MNAEKIKKVFSDEEFVTSLFELETPEEVQEALEEKEINLSTEEICQMRDFIIHYQDGELTEEEQKVLELAQKSMDGELSEEELENVSGGELFIAVSVGVTVGIALWITMRTLVGLVDDELKRRGRRW